jgi:major vault protein
MGPELLILNPDEQFAFLNLSGGKPKTPDQIKALCLLFYVCPDIIEIEIADHARLSFKLSYNWHFDVKYLN